MRLVKVLIIGDCLLIPMTIPSVVLAFFLPRPPVAWTGDVDKAAHQAHHGKIDLQARIHSIMTMDVMVHLARKPSLLNDYHPGNNLRNDHGETAAPRARTPATVVHLFLVATPAF